MQIDPVGKKANLIISLAMATGSNPQLAINKIRELPSCTGAETDLGSVFFPVDNGTFNNSYPKVGRLVTSLLDTNIDPNDSQKWTDWQDNFEISLRALFPNHPFEDRFSSVVSLPLHSWEFYENLISKMHDFTKPGKNREGSSEYKELESKLVDFPRNAFPYIDAILTREIGFQVSTFALRDGRDKILLPNHPLETVFYCTTISKFEKGYLNFASIIYKSSDKETARKIHEEAVRSGRKTSPKMVVTHLGSSEYNGLIYNVIYGNH